MIDEKKCYFFGRNKELCDFTSKIFLELNFSIKTKNIFFS
jgi:hypothetical protein